MDLIDIVAWGIAVLVLVGGVFCWLGMFTKKRVWSIICAVLAAGLAIIAFFALYSWLDYIPFGLFAAGGVLVAFGGGLDKTSSSASQKRTREYTFGDALMDTYCEYELQKEATKAAIREMEE